MEDQIGQARWGTERLPDVPLAVNVVWTAGDRGRPVVEHIVTTLVGEAESWGPRIPVSVNNLVDGALTAPLVLGDKTLVVLLVDYDMLDPLDESVSTNNLTILDSLVEEERAGTFGVLPIAVGMRLNNLSPSLRKINFAQVERDELEAATLRVVIGCLRVIQHLPVNPGRTRGSGRAFPSSRVSVFLSHAKVDFRSHARATVNALLESETRYGVEAWFDSGQIQPGQDFETELKRSIKRCDVLLAVLSDGYSDREWCRRELLIAKSYRKPVVVVDALHRGSSRLFPYIGNSPVIRWEAASETDGCWSEEAEAQRDGMLQATMLLTLQQALVCTYNERLLARTATGERVQAVSPELITLPRRRSAPVRVLHPDPPVSREEGRAMERQHKQVSMETPLTLLQPAEVPGTTVALSISEVLNDDGVGGTRLHLAAFWNDANLALLRCGYRVLYGGQLGYPGATRGEDFAARLADLALAHSPLLERMDADGVIVNLVSWPMTVTDADRDRVGPFFKLVQVKLPADVPGAAAAHHSPFARARALTEMREQSTNEAIARVSAGGKLSGYLGLTPGVVEELYLSLQAQQPVYLIGAAGGATKCVLDMLEGRARPELTSDWCADNVRGWTEVVAGYATSRTPKVEPDDIARYLRSVYESDRWQHPSFGQNGLTVDENIELSRTVDIRRAIALVLKGLGRCGKRVGTEIAANESETLATLPPKEEI